MIEPIIYLGISLLFACLVVWAVMPLVLRRTARSTARQHEVVFQSLAKMQDETNRLREELATSARTLEMIVEQLKKKVASQRVELDKNSDVVNRLKIERDMLKIDVATLQSQVHQHEQFRATEVIKKTSQQAEDENDHYAPQLFEATGRKSAS